MKNILLSIIAAAIYILPTTAAAQTTLWGMTSAGGTGGGGAIVKINTDGSNFSTAYNFENGGRSPVGELVAASNGNYYGTTTEGGANGLGVLYEYNPTSSVYTIKHHFAAATGSKPQGGLIELSGKLYGATYEGGTNSVGTIFEFDPTASTYTVRTHLATTTGKNPVGSLTVYNSKLYGTTAEGGANGGGVIFELNPTGWAYSVRHNFVLATGFAPYSTLAVYNSKLYGTTSEGGASNHGALFEFDPAASTYALKYSFVFASGGSNPVGSLAVIGTSLYGVASFGGANSAGTIYQWNVSSSTFTLKYSFASALTGTGHKPHGGVVAYNSKLYGTTVAGGTAGVGVLYEYDPTASTFTVKNNFAVATGFHPQSDLMLSGTKLIGTNFEGGTHGFGNIFQYDVAASTHMVKHNFGSSTGENPFGGLILHNGKYYGMTRLGGSAGGGVIFEFNPTGNVYIVKHNFTTATGRNPHGSLVVLNNKFYGLTHQGGANDLGALFEYDPMASTYTLKYSFGGATTFTNGFRPQGSLTVLNGNLYGTAFYGGTGSSTTVNGAGVIFEFNPTSSTYAVKYNFSATSGGTSPDGGSLVAYNSKLYGSAFHNGTSSHGTLFEYDPTGNVYTTKHNFTGTTGSFDFGGATLFNGNLYGVAGHGGSNNLGTLFSYNLTSSTYSSLYTFSIANGSTPEGQLVVANSKLYGTTYAGGSNSVGSIFEFNPTGNIYSVLKNLSSVEGSFPKGELLVGTSSGCTFSPTINPTAATICAGQNTTLTASGGATYVWSNGATTAAINVSPSATTTYTVTATDANSCTGTASATVTVNSLPQISISGNLTICAGGITILTASGGSTYLWSNGATTAVTTVNPSSTTSYIVTATAANGCTATTSATVTVNPLPQISISGNLTICAGGITILTASGGSTYLWSNGATTAATTVSPSLTTAYTVTATSAEGCTATASATVAVNTPTVFYQDFDEDGYGNPTVTLTSCDQPEGYVSNSTDCNDQNAAIHPAATETCNGTDDDCDTTIDEPLGGSLAATNPGCNTAGAIDLTPSCGLPPYTYSWSNGATTQDLANLVAGTYTVTLTDAQGLTKTLSATLTGVYGTFTVNFTIVKPSCPGMTNGSATANPTAGFGAYTYVWSTGATTKKLSNVGAGTYTVTVTGAGGCTKTGTATIADPTPLAVSLAISNVGCAGQSNGSITATVTGGTGAKTYLWSTGATTASIGNLTVGSYNVTVTDAKGCTKTATGSVIVASTLAVSLATTNVLCNGSSTGQIVATATGGTGTKNYLWSNGASTSTITGLAPATYSLTVTDDTGCSTTATAMVSQPAEPLTISVTSIQTLTNGRYRVNLAGAGGTPYSSGAAYRFRRCLNGTCTAWGSNAYYSNLLPNTYVFGVRDQNLCITEITVTVPAAAKAIDNSQTEKSIENKQISIKNSISFKLSPNPFNEKLYLQSDKISDENRRVQLFDLTGKMMIEQKWAAGMDSFELSLNRLSNGVYFVKIIEQDKQVGIIRAVKADK